MSFTTGSCLLTVALAAGISVAPAAAQSAAAVEQNLKIPANTAIPVRLIDAIDAKTGAMGKEYKASVAESIEIDGQTAVPKGAAAVIRIIDLKNGHSFMGKAQVTIALVRIEVNGRQIALDSGGATSQGGSNTGRSAAGVLVPTVIGVAVGAGTGGRSGAVRGAEAGVAIGATAAAAMPSPAPKLPSETLLTFTLAHDVPLQ